MPSPSDHHALPTTDVPAGPSPMILFAAAGALVLLGAALRTLTIQRPRAEGAPPPTRAPQP
jgi:hypothetical protein